MNLDRTTINLSQLRTNKQFNDLLGALEQELADARAVYEAEVASEFNRGRVAAYRELLEALQGNLGMQRGRRR